MGSVLAAAVLVLAACGSQNPSTSGPAGTAAPDASTLPGYLATPPGWAIFLEYTLSGGHLTGTVQVAYLPSGGSRVRTGSGSIDGMVEGSAVTIDDVDAVMSNGGTLSGGFQGSNLVVSFPQQNGLLAAVEFIPASVAGYDRAVASLQSQAARTAAAQQAAAAAAAAKRVAAAKARAAAWHRLIKAAQRACAAVGGQLAGLSCQNVPYLGSDGATYYLTLAVSSHGALEQASTAGSGSTEAECRSGQYPDANPGVGSPGHWDAQLGLCLP
jgi:hypothetical protein